MNKTIISIALSLICAQATAETYWYQPTPYPAKKSDGSAMPQSLSVLRIHDGWISNHYSALKSFQKDDKLKNGGWGDYYRSYINFDLVGLPSDASVVNMWLYSYAVPGANVTPLYICVPNATWNTSMTWDTQPTILGCTNPIAVQYDYWFGIGITSWYQNWKSEAWKSAGIMLAPQNYNNNHATHFRSSRYADYANNPSADGYRPILQFDFTPTLQLKMPLPGGYSWLVSTEVGGYDCKGLFDENHAGTRYFAIDLTNRSNGYPDTDIPVYAAASGKVLLATGGNTVGNFNGYYVVIDHDGDMNSGTGFQTWYVHLKEAPKKANGTKLLAGDTVSQGDKIGIMGNTGKDNAGNPTSFGTHLH